MCLAVPGQIREIDTRVPDFPTGRVDFGGVEREVALAFVPEAEVGSYVIVHVGVAISIVDEAEARRVFSYLEEIGEIEAFAAESAP